jgi:hypothetical protein
MDDLIMQRRAKVMDPGYLEFLDSSELEDTIAAFVRANDFDPDSARAFENGVQLYLLFFLTETAFVHFISKECLLEKGEAEMLINAFLLALPSDIRSVHEQTAIALAAPQTPHQTAPVIATSTTTPPPPEATIKGPEDVVYRSEQPSLGALRPRAVDPKAPSPSWSDD